MPSLSSFINASQYSTESTTLDLLGGMKLGSTFSAITFSGIGGAANNDPGGLFGWLVYARSALYSPAKGSTSATYIVYTTPQELVGDLNQLSGITSCLISDPLAGGTFGFFQTAGTIDEKVQLAPRPAGTDFLHAINYLAYGGTLVIVGSPVGFDNYIATTENYLDVIVGQEANTALCTWLIDQPYTTGIFPSIADSTGITGSGYTMANYASLFGNAALVTGNTVANRIFNVYGVKDISNLDTSTLQSNTQITYKLPTSTDVAGFFARAKNRNELYLSVAGLDRSTILNGNVSSSIDWNDSLKTTLRNNKVNFFVNYNPKFLGSDIVGATATGTLTNYDRVGPSRLRSALRKDLDMIGLKYLFEINNSTTRAQITSEIESAIDPYLTFIDTTRTQIICDSSNNIDNSGSLNMTVIIKPILSIDSFVIDINLTQ
jgi:hypothetical protein